MQSTVGSTEWKGEESTGKQSQAAFPFLGVVQAPQRAAEAFIAACDAVGAMRIAAQQSGKDDFEVADDLHISHGYMSKILHGTAGLHGKQLVRFMRVTQSLAPLQWLAHQMGCDVVQRDSRAARIAELEAELAAARKAA